MRCLPLLFLALTACGVEGGLEQADFEPADVGDDLAAGPLALGATVDINVSVDVPGAGTPSLELRAVDPEILQVTGNQLTGLSPGLSAVLALDERGRVLDFFHVFVAPPDRVEIQRLGGVGAGTDLDGGLELLVGDEVVLGARAYRGPQRLAGSAAMGWTADTDAVSILLDGDVDRRRLVARAPGKVLVEVETMGLISSLEITVYE
jgi:hypothetical protein